jgi:hypothetical protein
MRTTTCACAEFSAIPDVIAAKHTAARTDFFMVSPHWEQTQFQCRGCGEDAAFINGTIRAGRFTKV